MHQRKGRKEGLLEALHAVSACESPPICNNDIRQPKWSTSETNGSVARRLQHMDEPRLQDATAGERDGVPGGQLGLLPLL